MVTRLDVRRLRGGVCFYGLFVSTSTVGLSLMQLKHIGKKYLRFLQVVPREVTIIGFAQRYDDPFLHHLVDINMRTRVQFFRGSRLTLALALAIVSLRLGTSKRCVLSPTARRTATERGVKSTTGAP